MSEDELQKRYLENTILVAERYFQQLFNVRPDSPDITKSSDPLLLFIKDRLIPIINENSNDKIKAYELLRVEIFISVEAIGNILGRDH